MVFGAAVVATGVACSDSATPTDGGTAPDGTSTAVAPPYGIPPMDAAFLDARPADAGADSPSAAYGAPPPDANIQPPYGSPPPLDAGRD